jgi:hypothetical protein
MSMIPTFPFKMMEAEFTCVYLAWNNLAGSRHFSVQSDMLAQILNSRDSHTENSTNIQTMHILGVDD